MLLPNSSRELVGASTLLLMLAKDEPLLLTGSVSIEREVLGAGDFSLRGTLVTALHRTRSCLRGEELRGSRGQTDPACRWAIWSDIAAGRQPKPTVPPQQIERASYGPGDALCCGSRVQM